MKRIVLSLLVAALFIIVTPVLAQEEATVDLAKTSTNQCPCTGPSIEKLVYNDRDIDGQYEPSQGEELWDQWGGFLYKIDTDGDWIFLDSTLTGGSDGIFYSGSDTGKGYFRPLQVNTLYAVCAAFPRSWLFLTEPTLDPLSKSSSLSVQTVLDELIAESDLTNSEAWVGTIENPQPLAWDNPEPGARNWDETEVCYWVYPKSTCNNIKVRFGVLTYDTLGNIVSPSIQR